LAGSCAGLWFAQFACCACRLPCHLPLLLHKWTPLPLSSCPIQLGAAPGRQQCQCQLSKWIAKQGQPTWMQGSYSIIHLSAPSLPTCSSHAVCCRELPAAPAPAGASPPAPTSDAAPSAPAANSNEPATPSPAPEPSAAVEPAPTPKSAKQPSAAALLLAMCRSIGRPSQQRATPPAARRLRTLQQQGKGSSRRCAVGRRAAGRQQHQPRPRACRC
jgi:hypothetical protein